MINFKKMDDKVFVFINKNLSEKDDQEFSNFLKKRKTRNLPTNDKNKSKELQNKGTFTNKVIRKQSSRHTFYRFNQFI
jgi:hypothetical protein